MDYRKPRERYDWGTLRTSLHSIRILSSCVQHLPHGHEFFALISLVVGYTRLFTAPLLRREFTKRGFLDLPAPMALERLRNGLVLGRISNPIIIGTSWCSLATVIEYSTGLVLERRFCYSMFKLHGQFVPRPVRSRHVSVTSVFVLVPTMLNILMIFSKHTGPVVAFIVVTLYFWIRLLGLLPLHKVEAAAQDAAIKVEKHRMLRKSKALQRKTHLKAEKRSSSEGKCGGPECNSYRNPKGAQQVSQKVQVTKQK